MSVGSIDIHTDDVCISYSSFGTWFWSKSAKEFWIDWYNIYIEEKGVLLSISSSIYEYISFPSLVSTWMSSTVVPSDEVEPIVVVDLVKTCNGKLTSDAIVKTGAI